MGGVVGSATKRTFLFVLTVRLLLARCFVRTGARSSGLRRTGGSCLPRQKGDSYEYKQGNLHSTGRKRGTESLCVRRTADGEMATSPGHELPSSSTLFLDLHSRTLEVSRQRIQTDSCGREEKQRVLLLLATARVPFCQPLQCVFVRRPRHHLVPKLPMRGRMRNSGLPSACPRAVALPPQQPPYLMRLGPLLSTC